MLWRRLGLRLPQEAWAKMAGHRDPSWEPSFLCFTLLWHAVMLLCKLWPALSDLQMSPRQGRSLLDSQEAKGEPWMSVWEPQMGLSWCLVLPLTLPGEHGPRDQTSVVQLVFLKEVTFHAGNWTILVLSRLSTLAWVPVS